MSQAPRLAPLEPPFEPSLAESFARRMPKDSSLTPLALFRLFARDRGLWEAIEPLGRFNLKYAPGKASSLPPRDREIVIDRVCALCRCEYEWGIHVARYAAEVGLTSDQIVATVQGGADDPAFDARDRALLALVDALHYDAHVSDDVWAGVAPHWSETQLLEILVLSGWYHAIAYVANGARLPLESWAARFPPAVTPRL